MITYDKENISSLDFLFTRIDQISKEQGVHSIGILYLSSVHPECKVYLYISRQNESRNHKTADEVIYLAEKFFVIEGQGEADIASPSNERDLIQNHFKFTPSKVCTKVRGTHANLEMAVKLFNHAHR